MYKLLVKLFIKDNERVEDVKVRSKYGILSGIVGIVTNLILCAIKSSSLNFHLYLILAFVPRFANNSKQQTKYNSS